MPTRSFDRNDWGLILGGSSGFGLATARKLAAHGMNLCLVHRDRRGAMRRIEPAFEAIRERGVELLTFNTDALAPENREAVLDGLAGAAGEEGRVKVLLHSIAFGNLKLLAPERPLRGRTAGTGGDASGEPAERADAREEAALDAARVSAAARLARELGLEPGRIEEAADRLFREEGVDGLQGLASPPEYPEGRYLDEEDMARTVHAMGTSLVGWTRAVLERGLFAGDARVLGLTSEGNEVAWKGYAAVSAAKAALEAVSRSIAVEMAPHGIRSNVVQAGVTDTAALRAIPGSEHLRAQARRRNPSGRLTTPEDVADALFLLCLPEAAWINGALIRADGGERISGGLR